MYKNEVVWGLKNAGFNGSARHVKDIMGFISEKHGIKDGVVKIPRSTLEIFNDCFSKGIPGNLSVVFLNGIPTRIFK